MANVNYIKGLNFEDGNSLLLAVYGNDVAKFSTPNWVGTSQNLVPGDYMIVKGKSYGYLTGLGANSRVVDSSGVWSQQINMTNAPRAKYCYPFGDRMFFANCSFNSNNYERRAFYTDIIEKDDKVVWGLEYGSDIVQLSGGTTITSSTSRFIDSGIKIGDPLVIIDGSNAGNYAVEEVLSQTSILLNKPLNYNSTANKFYIGGNWFDLSGAFTGFGEHYGVLLAFETNKVWRWSQSVGKKEVIGVKGTFLYKSIVSNHRSYTFWYHPSDGIIQFNGNVGITCSSKIAPILDGMTDKSAVVGWPGVGKYKDHVYFYIGNTTFNVNGISYSLNKVIIDYNIVKNKWKVFEYSSIITCATTFIESNEEVVYLGTSQDIILKFGVGNSDYDTTADDDSTLPIHTYMITHPVFPSGIEIMNEFSKYYAWADGGSVKSRYMLHGRIDRDDSDWSDMFELNEKYGEIKISPQNSMSRGISFMISEISKDPSFEFLGFSVIYVVSGEAFEDQK